MARFIQAFVQYGPRLNRRPKATLQQVTERIALATGTRPSVVVQVLMELNDTILCFGRRGSSVELPGMGTFLPTVKGDGWIRVVFRPDPSLKQAYRALDDFDGELVNRHRIGLSAEDYKHLWDADHPDDPLELPAGGRHSA